MKLQRLSADIISTLPTSIIETILCLVPIEEAARTSILSKEWRYKWTKIPKLVFDDSMIKGSSYYVFDSEQTAASERKKMGKRCKLFYAIYQVLLMRQAPIHEFSLRMAMDKTCAEIDLILGHLSRNNTIKKLKLDLYEKQRGYYWLPLSFFSFHHLADLYLCDCDLNIQQTFRGFARLTKLYLKDVHISMKTLLHILSSSPELQHLTLIINEDLLIGDANTSVIELFKCLPMLEHLSTYGWITECLDIDSVPQELPTLLNHLKCFTMDFMSFAFAEGLRFLALLIRSSPNLEKITLEIFSDEIDDEMVNIIREAYSEIWMEQLNKVEIYGFRNFKSDLEFLKFILVKSPKLKKVHLCFDYEINKKEKSKMLRKLLRSPPASSVVEIIVTSRHWVYNTPRII